MSRLALLLCLAAAACALQPPSPQAFTFGVMGDAPYSKDEEKVFVEMIDRINTERLAFVVHVGDIKGGGGACSDALYETRKAQFNRSRHPFIYTPGDNEWTDCRYRAAGSMSPIERLARLREIFFADPSSLGERKIETSMQPGYPENRTWAHGGVVFVTLNIPGSNNNVGFDAANDEEARNRDRANARWLEAAVESSRAQDVRALVVLLQANPWFGDHRPDPYAPFLDHFKRMARSLAKPILFVHGDTHTFRVDWPFADARGAPIDNVTRLETYGSPFVGWVKVRVDPSDAQPFRITGQLEALVSSSIHGFALLREVIVRARPGLD